MITHITREPQVVAPIKSVSITFNAEEYAILKKALLSHSKLWCRTTEDMRNSEATARLLAQLGAAEATS